MCADNNTNAVAQPSTAATQATQSNNTTDHEVMIVAEDHDESDAASNLGSTVASSSTSVSSSILEYRMENGRTYHAYKDGNLQHNLFILTFDNKLATAPPNDPGSKVGNVLDVGTGSGIWAIDFGEEHPDAEVCGVDLSAVQPEFNLSPGGCLELIEFDAVPTSDDGTLKPDSAITKSATLLFDAAAIIGRPFEDISRMKDVLIETGFEDVHKQLYKWPTNSWPKDPKYKELGIWNHENAIAGWEGFCMAPCTRIHGWSREEVLVLMAEARKEFKDRTIHAYFNM
ncbi:hypothetical protein COL516b_001647 [Colletotrichum fioriniae]|nr:uncharacterized protein COL516b_001647 [Colletotrichum fioriniae]KAJ0310947.1 hypothetical protein COL516b_001647 [Colletotrichum fioriniae]